MKILRILAKFNGNTKTLYSLNELNSEYQTYKDLHSLRVTVFTDSGEIELSLLSIFYFMTKGIIGGEEIE
jgi:hypothetical protein